MTLSDFDYDLPQELIAQEPLPERDASRMLVLHRATQRWEDRRFRDLPQYLGPGDCLVMNDSRVIPSRLHGTRTPGSVQVEALLLEQCADNLHEWKALVRPGKRVRVGDRLVFDENCTAEVIAHGERGERTLRFDATDDVYEVLERLGHVPLPPYIKRPDSNTDRERYQTVYSAARGSVAAPTAGLHFTNELLDSSRQAGAIIAPVTLHVGLGTFQPLEGEVFEGQRLHRERYRITAESWQTIEQATRVLAVGTTSVRTMETAAMTGKLEGSTDIFIYPGYEFQRVGAILTNFHLPKTSLLLLVSAFAGTDFVRAAYRHAVESRYRFFSYGDCMLIV